MPERDATSAGLIRVCLLAAAGLAIGFAPGCSRAYYRQKADRETYGAICERVNDPRWKLPSVSIEPSERSRNFDPFDPDHPPIPPDDPAAHRYMHCVNGIEGAEDWHEDGNAPWIESPDWQQWLQVSEDGRVILTPEHAVELGLLHSREYQSQLEDVYLSSLALTLERFEFDVQWFGGNDTTYARTGGTATESNSLDTSSNLGFQRNFSRGGQLVVDFANSFVWEFTGADVSRATSNLAVTLTQPLLRQAAREVRLEQLTQQERAVLYAVRDFARYRKEFYVGITTGGSGFLALLLQLQNIRNQESNLDSLEQNLLLHDALAESGTVSNIQVDQVFQSYQQGRLSLLQAQSDFETSLDTLKITLGLPPTVKITLDDSLLAPFQLTDPSVTGLEKKIDAFLAGYRELDEAPSLDRLHAGYQELEGYHKPVEEILQLVRAELQAWRSQWSSEAEGTSEHIQQRREQLLYEQLERQLNEIPTELSGVHDEAKKTANGLTEENRTEGWDALQESCRKYLEVLAELFVIETEVRVYLIELPPVGHQSEDAIEFAVSNRLDLMNQKARVVDAWRQITVAADGLESDLDVVFDADIGTDPAKSNPLEFSDSATTYRLGLRFDAPLNRKIESNIYRTRLVNYQRARRSYISLKDQIQQAIRRDLRQLETNRLNFEIARESLVVAARQVEQTRDQLLLAAAPGDSSSTQDVLNALNALLQAKNTLIGIWVSFHRNRMQLLLDLEALQLDERGILIDESADFFDQPSGDSAAPLGSGERRDDVEGESVSQPHAPSS